MKILKDRLLKDGKVIGDDVLEVDSFLKQQLDPVLMKQMADEFYERFKEKKVTKILTVEASGIAPAIMVGYNFNVPVVFGRKQKSVTLNDNMYSATVFSYTHQTSNEIVISRDFLSADDHVLIIDDFLANGQAVEGLLDIVNQAEATVAGIGISVEKSFQKGRKMLDEQGYQVESLARISSFEGGKIHFLDEE
ncbi:xanthine phosphoribosyltransferase [Holzapfeliella sp. He02]|uniref:Xanthine phosphoribosyltransferase n=1 Tax=Holzapfeliella saturejae TaxID=3082953 RepID=A0ABU8SH84_9LACO